VFIVRFPVIVVVVYVATSLANKDEYSRLAASVTVTAMKVVFGPLIIIYLLRH